MEQYNDIFKKLEDLVLCPICLQRFVSPKTLECQHTFCSKCLKSLHAKEQRLVCPICRRDSFLNVTISGNQNCTLAQLNELKDEIKDILMQKAGEIRIVVAENINSIEFKYFECFYFLFLRFRIQRSSLMSIQRRRRRKKTFCKRTNMLNVL